MKRKNNYKLINKFIVIVLILLLINSIFLAFSGFSGKVYADSALGENSYSNATSNEILNSNLKQAYTFQGKASSKFNSTEISYPAYDGTPKLSIGKWTVNASLQNDGTLHMEEYLNYNFQTDGNGLTRKIYFNVSRLNSSMSKDSSRYEASDLTNLKVFVKKGNDNNYQEYTETTSASKGDEGVYTSSKTSQELDLTIYSPMNSQTGHEQTLKLSYDLTDVGVQYNDAGEIYYDFLGNIKSTNVSNFEMFLKLPDGIDLANTQIYPHTFATSKNNIIVEKDSSKNLIYLAVNKKNISDAIDARIVFPIANSRISFYKKYNQNYDYGNLKTLETVESLGAFKNGLKWIVTAILVGVIIYLIVNYVQKSKKFGDKHKITFKNANYYRDIPNRLNLLEYQVLLPSMNTSNFNSNMILATILDLVDKKALNMEVLDNNKPKTILVLRPEKIYHLGLNPSYNYNALADYEKILLGVLFDSSIYFDPAKCMGRVIDLNDRLEAIGKDYILLDSARVSGLIKEENYYDDHYKDPENKKIKSAPLKIVLLTIITPIVYSILNSSNGQSLSNLGDSSFFIIFALFFVLPFILPAFVALRNNYKTPKSQYVEDTKEIYGLRKYLIDYSRIKERYPIEIHLWNRYLVFAALFGIADQVSKEIKEELLAKGYDETYINTYCPTLYMSSYASGIPSAISTNTSSSSSDSGSSGSSGFGGGGGGGRRWLCRSILATLVVMLYHE